MWWDGVFRKLTEEVKSSWITWLRTSEELYLMLCFFFLCVLKYGRLWQLKCFRFLQWPLHHWKLQGDRDAELPHWVFWQSWNRGEKSTKGMFQMSEVVSMLSQTLLLLFSGESWWKLIVLSWWLCCRNRFIEFIRSLWPLLIIHIWITYMFYISKISTVLETVLPLLIYCILSKFIPCKTYFCDTSSLSVFYILF